MVIQQRIVDIFWDLRDDAYDHPSRWSGVTAQQVFQRLAELVEAADPSGEAADWFEVRAGILAWRTEGPAD